MTGDTCIVCGNTRKKEPKLSFHRLPKDVDKHAKWLKVFGLFESQLKSHTRVCSRHFRDGDLRNGPEMTVGKRFASLMKKDVPRSKRAKVRQLNKAYQ